MKYQVSAVGVNEEEIDPAVLDHSNKLALVSPRLVQDEALSNPIG
jgi:hypothetical protein